MRGASIESQYPERMVLLREGLSWASGGLRRIIVGLQLLHSSVGLLLLHNSVCATWCVKILPICCGAETPYFLACRRHSRRAARTSICHHILSTWRRSQPRASISSCAWQLGDREEEAPISANPHRFVGAGSVPHLMRGRQRAHL